MRAPATGITIGGAVVAGIAASTCCLGPLVLAVLGVGGSATALAFEPYRPWLLALTGLLLGGAFYLTYRRPAGECGPDGACEVPRAGRAGKAFLWIATVLIVLAVTFPYYSGPATARTSAAAGSAPAKTVLTIDGMTCGGCVASVQRRLDGIEGVVFHEVSLERGEAEVAYDPALTGPETIAAAVSETGFKAAPRSHGRP
jgi:mercuric ion transport protein